jgi:hypothetical protein
MIAKGFPPARVGDVARAFAAIPVVVRVVDEPLPLRPTYADTLEDCAASGCALCLREVTDHDVHDDHDQARRDTDRPCERTYSRGHERR